MPEEEIQDVRPPYGLFTPPVLDALLRHRYRPVMWSIVPFHWHQMFDEAVVQVERQLGAGALIVLHEGMRAGSDVARLAEAGSSACAMPGCPLSPSRRCGWGIRLL